MPEDDGQTDSRSRQSGIRFDFVIQLGHVLQIFAMLGAVLVAALSLYNTAQTKFFEQDKLYSMLKIEQDKQYTILKAALDAQAADIRSLREGIIQVKNDQKETDNAIRTTLTQISERVNELRIGLGNSTKR